MILWDAKTKEQYFRIRGKEEARIGEANFVGTKPDLEKEADIKTLIDTKTSKCGFHSYTKILNKSPLQYVTWLGSLAQEPHAGWPEPLSPIKAKSDKNLRRKI